MIAVFFEGGVLVGGSELFDSAGGLLVGGGLEGVVLDSELVESASSGWTRIRSILPMPCDKVKLFLQHSSSVGSLL